MSGSLVEGIDIECPWWDESQRVRGNVGEYLLWIGLGAEIRQRGASLFDGRAPLTTQGIVDRGTRASG